MKKEGWSRPDEGAGKVVEVLAGMNHVALKIQFETNDGADYGLYRPERGLSLSVDPRVPKPAELYRDVAFARMFNWLNWEGVPMVYPWQLKPGDKGVIRPFFPEVKNMEVYHFRKDRMLADKNRLWRRLAVADYVGGVGDRVSNDFLVIDDAVMVVDSGFSFLPGMDFVGQQSICRELFLGEQLDPETLLEVIRLRAIDLSIFEGLLGEEEIYWFVQRIERVIAEKKFL